MFTSILILRRIKIEWDRLKEERKGVCCEAVHIKIGKFSHPLTGKFASTCPYASFTSIIRLLPGPFL